MKYFITVFLACSLLKACVIEAQQYVNAFASVNNPCANVRNGELVCADCATLAWCVQEGGDWHTLEIGTCDTGRKFYCSDTARGCILQNECDLTVPGGIGFECQNPGQFPDPYNCKYYHVCDSYNRDTRQICASGWQYSVEEKSCIIQTSSADCKKAKYQCNKPGAMGAWPGDETIYYICYTKKVDGEFTLYPLLYRCDNNKVFDGEKCISRSEQKEPINNGGNTGAVDTDISTTCSGYVLTADAKDCRSYYYCTRGQLISNSCPAGTHFDSNKQACTAGSC